MIWFDERKYFFKSVMFCLTSALQRTTFASLSVLSAGTGDSLLAQGWVGIRVHVDETASEEETHRQKCHGNTDQQEGKKKNFHVRERMVERLLKRREKVLFGKRKEKPTKFL